MRTTTLGDLGTSAMGLGCMGMSEAYGSTDWDTSIAVIRQALDLGVTLVDTADVYGAGHNEVLVGRAIAGRRDEVQVATKVGIDRTGGDESWVLRGEPAYIKRGCDASLLRLGVDVIDLYYLHRPPQIGDIEDAVGAMSELVAAGKVRHVGLSEVDDRLLRRAHAVHPIAAVQSEYSIWTRDPELSVVGAMRELGVGLVAYAPLGRGFLTGALDAASLDAGDMRRRNPRFVGEAADANMAIAETIGEIARSHEATPAQVALAWVIAQAERLGISVVPIPGTRRVERLKQNVGALELTLTDEDDARLSGLADRVAGARY